MESLTRSIPMRSLPTGSPSITWVAPCHAGCPGSPNSNRNCSPRLARSWPLKRASRMATGLPSGRNVVRWAKAMVTPRMKPLQIEGRTVHQIGLPYHWGYQGVVKGDVANDLLLLVADRNVSMHDAKAFTCNMRPGRRSHQGQDGSIVARELP